MGFHQIITKFRKKLADAEGVRAITQAEITDFYNQINALNLTFVLFPKYYKKYIKNLNSLRPDSYDSHPDLSLLKVALRENEWKPTKPADIFIHYLKYENVLSSKFFISREKKQNKKKLNSPKAKTEVKEKPKAEKEWIRVPIPRHHNSSVHKSPKKKF